MHPRLVWLLFSLHFHSLLPPAQTVFFFFWIFLLVYFFCTTFYYLWRGGYRNSASRLRWLPFHHRLLVLRLPRVIALFSLINVVYLFIFYHSIGCSIYSLSRLLFIYISVCVVMRNFSSISTPFHKIYFTILFPVMQLLFLFSLHSPTHFLYLCVLFLRVLILLRVNHSLISCFFSSTYDPFFSCFFFSLSVQSSSPPRVSSLYSCFFLSPFS